MGERGGAMTVISLQKQPGTVERDGSRRVSPPILAAASLPTGHRVAEPLLAIETSDFDQRLQLVGASHARAAAGMYGAGPVGTSTQRRDFAADPLQMQRGAITDAIRDCSTGQLRVKPRGCPVHRLRLDGGAIRLGENP
jgi:hypothetical protein